MYPKKLKKGNPFSYSYTDDGRIVRCFTQKNYSIGMHMQDFFEINIITNGEGMHYIEDSRLQVSSGDVFVIPPKISHGYYGSAGFDVCHILISNSFMEKYMADLQLLPSFYHLFNAEPLLRKVSQSPLHLTLSKSEFLKASQLTYALCTASAAPINSTSFVNANSLAMLLISYLCELYEIKSPSTSKDTEDIDFMNALATIHRNYNHKITIEELAKTAHLSRSTFIRKFNNICKMSPARYITLTRLDAAKQILSSTALSIEETAQRCGFYDTSHFVKVFTAEFRISPGNYRKKK